MINIWRKDKSRKKVEVFTASIADIKKALRLRSTTDPRTKMPKHFSEYLDVADYTEADKLPPLCRPEIDYRIKLQEVNGKTLEVL